MQLIYQIIASYFEDDCADEQTNDPVLTAVLEKETPASQPTFSRFCNRMDEDTLAQFDQIDSQMRDSIYSIKQLEHMLFDLDSTLLNAYGTQEGEGFNYHYQTSSWSQPRRVVFKVGKPTNQLIHMFTFIMTTMEIEPYQVIQFYCGHGKMENFIKECKSGFDFGAVSSYSKVVNVNRLRLHMLAYNLFNWFRHLVLPANMRKQQINTICLKLLKVAAKIVHSARYITFKLCSSCPYKKEFYAILKHILGLCAQLESS